MTLVDSARNAEMPHEHWMAFIVHHSSLFEKIILQLLAERVLRETIVT